ncbi:MAG: response regulator [Microcoleus sp.]
MKNIVLTILEDDPAHIFVIQSTLKTSFKDIKFYLAKNGRELLEMLPGSKADLLLLDINTPEINGLECTQIVRKEPSYNYLPIVMFSSSDKESVRSQAFSYGADAYYVKPSQDKYAETLGQIFDNSYPKRLASQKPLTLPPLIESTSTAKKDDAWADLDEMMGDL